MSVVELDVLGPGGGAARPKSGSASFAQQQEHERHDGYNISGNDAPLTAHLSTCCLKDAELRHALWNALTGEEGPFPYLTRGTDAYFEYYDALVTRWRPKCSIKTHLQLIDVVRDLRGSTSYEEVVRRLTAQLRGQAAQDVNHHSEQAPSDLAEQQRTADSVQATISLAARILSMHSVGRFPHTISPEGTIAWHEGRLNDKLREVHAPCPVTGSGVWLNFDAAKLDRMAGLNIEFTDKLEQHLMVLPEEKGSRLFIFHQVRYLEIMDQNRHTTIFPAGFLSDTLRTLDLLFPPGNKRVFKQFRARVIDSPRVDSLLLLRLRAQGHIDSNSAQYPFWRDRLNALKDVFVSLEPESMFEAMLDRRRPAERFAIILGLTALFLTAFFGLVQSIEGGIQVYKAYIPSVGP